MPSRRTLALAIAGPVLGLVIISAVIVRAYSPPIIITAPNTASPVQTYAPPAAAPVQRAAKDGSSITAYIDRDWLRNTSKETGIPIRALEAYAGAAVAKNKTDPACGISWNTLAAIGFVESKDGRYGGGSIAADGKITPGIYGVALDGRTTQHIPDSDDGKYDGDKKYDRAIGPMQMIPQTWKNWQTDANGDGKKDPQNMDDAVMAAANYLCRASPDMISVDGWKAGIRAYNSAPSYLVRVAKNALKYAAASS
jgi:membrane-bound lytic murein transglycosylase B